MKINPAKISASLLGLSLLVACGQSEDDLSQKDLSICSKTNPSQEAIPAGVQADLFRVYCDSGETTKPTAFRKVAIDELKSREEIVNKRLVASQGVGLDQTVYIYTTNAGSKIQPESLTYQGDDLTREEYKAVQPLISEIMTAYGNPKSKIGQLRALRDWIARIAIHPHAPFHSVAKKTVHVLPEGWDWQKFISIVYKGDRIQRDSKFWSSYNLNGYAMLNKLVNFDGTEANPMLEKLAGPAEFRIKNIEEDTLDASIYHTVLCTYQGQMMLYLAAAHGIYGTLVSTTGHDTFAFYVPELAQWVYMDPSYNEDFISSTTGRLASPADLYVASAMGTMYEDYITTKISGPIWDPEVYIDPKDHPRATYMGDGHPNGMTAMGSNLWQKFPVPLKTNLLQFDAPIFYNNPIDPSTVGLSKRKRVQEMGVLFPTLGVSVANSTQLSSDSIQLSLASNWPNHHHFEIQEGDGSWLLLNDNPILKVGYGAINIRSVNNAGVPSTVARFEARRI